MKPKQIPDVGNGNNSIAPDFKPQQKPKPMPKSKSKKFFSNEANCDKCKIGIKYSTESYDAGRLCFECMVEWVYSKDTGTDDESKLFGCDFCDEKYIQPEIYIHIDKEHYDEIIQSEMMLDIESTDSNEVLPNSKFPRIVNNDAGEIFSEANNENIIQSENSIKEKQNDDVEVGSENENPKFCKIVNNDAIEIFSEPNNENIHSKNSQREKQNHDGEGESSNSKFLKLADNNLSVEHNEQITQSKIDVTNDNFSPKKEKIEEKDISITFVK